LHNSNIVSIDGPWVWDGWSKILIFKFQNLWHSNPCA
jgi:hypothetical protein